MYACAHVCRLLAAGGTYSLTLHTSWNSHLGVPTSYRYTAHFDTPLLSSDESEAWGCFVYLMLLPL